MKKIILLVLSLIVCMLASCGTTERQTLDGLNGSKTAGSPVVLYELMPSAPMVRSTGGNWLENVGALTTVDITGTTKDGFTYKSGAYCAHPNDGYTFVNSDVKHLSENIIVKGNFSGKVTAITGTIKGLDTSKHVWNLGIPVTDGWEQKISAISLEILNKNDEELTWDFVPFEGLLVQNGNDYDFRFNLKEEFSDVVRIKITFSIYYKDEVTELDAFTLSSFNVIGFKED